MKGGTDDPGRRHEAELSDDGSLPVCHESCPHPATTLTAPPRAVTPQTLCQPRTMCPLSPASKSQAGAALGTSPALDSGGDGRGSPEPDVGMRSGALPGADPVHVSLLGTTRPGGSFVRERRLFTGRSPGACSCQLRGAEPGVQGPPASRDTASSNAETQHRALEELTMKTKTARTGDVSLPGYLTTLGC